MGRFADKAKQIKQTNEGKFQPLDLTEGNVQAIFNQCGKENEDGSTTWNEEKLAQNKANIRYLLGQLALVHEGITEHILDSEFVKRYDGKTWTDSTDTLLNLLNMGGSSHFCAFYKKDNKQLVELKIDMTLSPKDPAFPAWWETAETLVLRAEIADDSGNLSETMALYKKAAELGNADAQYKVGSMYNDGMGTAVDKAKALMWYERAAEQGHAAAQYKCAGMYYEGDGIAVDKSKALMWSERVAEQGHAAVQYNCATMYYIGIGTEVDKSKALMWCERAAEQGHIDAQCNCAIMYLKGEGTAVDTAKALMWYEKAAEQGHANAQYFCAMMYYVGAGTAVDKAKARMWYEKAAAQTEDKETQEQAKEALRELF